MMIPKLQLKEVLFCAVDNKSGTGGLSSDVTHVHRGRLHSWVLGLGSWVLGLGSWVLGLGSWVLGLGSCVEPILNLRNNTQTVASGFKTVDRT
jgi:hypothetical protein